MEITETEAFLLRVIKSCQTQEQLAWARQWCMRVQNFEISPIVSETLIKVDDFIEVDKIEPWLYGNRHAHNRELSFTTER